ncbi:MAG: dUTP diphosphatase [Pseudomonadota bacterium]
MRLADHAVGPPIYATEGAAGADLQAANPEDAPIHLEPGRVIAAPTGVILALPEGVEAQIRPRSGLARRHGVTVANAPGTIDWDYRGEIQVLLINLGAETLEITRGMRIAQLVLAPVLRGVFEPASALDETARGAGGFGSTGFGSTGPDATGPGPGGRG